jgi:hypothetical protein
MPAELDELKAVLAKNEEQVGTVCRRLFGSANSQVGVDGDADGAKAVVHGFPDTVTPSAGT